MKTTIHQGIASHSIFHPFRQHFGRAMILAAIGLGGLLPASHGQTNTNGCTAAPNGLVSWWRAEGNAADQTLANNGNLLSNGPFVTGAVGQAFVLTNGGYVQIPSSPSLNVGLGAGLTVEGWIYPFTVTTGHPIAEWPVPGGYGVHFFTWNNGAIYAAVVDTNGNYNILESSPGVLSANQWQHVALSYDKASGLGRVLVNGVTVATAQLGSFTPKTDTELLIGYRPSTSPFGPVSFEGLIDELSLYNRALTTNEISAIVAAGSAGKCPSSTPTPPRWMVNVDFGAGLNGTGKTGFAAIGQTTNDFWNYYSRDDDAGGWRTFGVLSDLKTVGDAVTPAGLTVANAPGAWGNGSPDTMYDGYIYPFNDGNVTVTLSNLPAGQYELLAYANDGNFELAVGSSGYGVRTTLDITPTNAPAWTAGVQYAHYTNVSVTAGQPLVLTVRPGVYGYAIISGLQLAAALTTNTVPGTNPPSVACVAPPAGLIGWWRAESTVMDSVSSANGELLGGASFDAGLVGQAFRVNGDAGQLVRVPDAPSLNLTQHVTFEAWINVTAHSANDVILVAGKDAPDGVRQYMIGLLDVGDHWVFRAHLGLTSGFQVMDGNAPIATNSWYHALMTYNGAEFRLYVNGVLDAVMPASGAMVTSSSPLWIGGFGTGPWNFNGRVDEVSLYNRALTTNEIAAIYNAGSAGKCSDNFTNPPAGNCVAVPSGAISWWRGEGSALDNIRTNNGTVVGGVTTVPGKVGNGFGFDGTGYIVVPHDASLNCSNALTIELWYNSAQNNNPDYGLIDKRVGFVGANFGINVIAAAGLGAYYDDLGVQDGDDLGSSFETSRYTPIPAPGMFHHLAATYWQISNNLVQVQTYLNGQNVRTRYIAGNLANTINTAPLTIGATAQGMGEFFKGVIDEVTLYDRVLNPAEIQSIYAADTAGKCGGIITNPPWLSPTITQQPQGLVVIAGSDVLFNVVATGIPAPSYQWYFGADLLPGQTSPTLTLTNAQLAQSGAYAVRVSNPYGSVLSSNAILTVVTAQAALLVDANTPAYYNDSLGTILDGTAPQFPLPYGDPDLFPADEPNLAAGAGILGNWLTNPPDLNTNWHAVAVVPTTWELNTETAIIYVVDGGQHGVMNLQGDFDADNGIFVWVNGQYRFGARQPGLPSPTGQFEYANIFLGSLAPGTNYIQILREDSGITAGSQIRLTGTALSTNGLPPVITQSPTNQLVAAGNSSLFTVVAVGTPELSYQWRFRGENLAGQTSNSLVLLNVQPTNAGNYSVLVSNPYGSVTSSIATLSVLTYPPGITKQPTNFAAIVTTAASFSVQATGSMSLTYQWLLNGSPLAGKTATTLSFPSVQFSNAGNYSVIITNPYGAVTSSIATLTVNPLPPCAPVHDGLVSWWKGETNLIDNWDSNNAGPFGSYQAGKVGRAFFNPLLTVADAPSLRITNGLTIEAWINPSITTGTRVILSKYEYPFSQPVGSQSAYLLGTTNNGAPFFALTPNGSTRTNATLIATNTLPVNQWSHVAATYDGAIMRLYLNGVPVAQTNYTGRIFPGTTPLSIGGFPPGTSSPWQYNGLLDEVSIYNRALSTAEIQTIVAADLTGKCLAPPVITQQPQDQAVPLGEDVKLTATVAGSRPLTYQWYLNGPATQFTTQRIIGATNAALVVEKVKTNNAGTYTLRVTNSVGFDLSAPAQITLLPAPTCIDTLPGLISWWTGDINTLDAMGLNNISTYSPLGYPTGKVASAFTFNGSNSRITINNSTSLNFSSNANFSIEMWIRATNAPGQTGFPYPNVPLFEKRTTATTGWVGYSLSLNQGQLAFAIGTPGTIAPGAVSNYISSGPDLRDAMFHHVAVTVNRSTTNGGVLYVDGVPVLTFNPNPLNVSLVNTSPLFIGAPTVTLSNSFFAGLIDEPAIYNRDLAAAEILSIRTAGAAGRCKSPPFIVTQPVGVFVTNGGSATLTVTATGTPLLRYQWRRNAIPVNGATNATLNLTNDITAKVGTYSVIVSNAFGSALSSNAVIALNRLPIANADALNTASNTPAVFPAAKLILNDTDADGDSLTVTSVSTNSAQNGTVSLIAGQVTYSPPTNYVGNDTFTYLLADKPGGTAVGTVMVTVGNGGAAPLNIVFGPVIDNGQFVARFAGIPGLTYTIEAAPTPLGAWSKVANVTAPMTDTGLGIGVFEFREPVGGAASRYYRTVYPSY